MAGLIGWRANFQAVHFEEDECRHEGCPLVGIVETMRTCHSVPYDGSQCDKIALALIRMIISCTADRSINSAEILYACQVLWM